MNHLERMYDLGLRVIGPAHDLGLMLMELIQVEE